ncbi:oxidoreductase, 2OG-Fe(II) oxygenase family [mine drainage metagenome]|uniref:Oxidoreductase, 2OG-Fe(II) oxygenase family n=1 Tax=mine drainage metagenome TaxID=410659 RepID=T1C751_9ZZZZ
MFLVLPDVLTPAEREAVYRGVLALPFEDGARTTGPGARGRKHNLQLSDSDVRAEPLRRVILDALSRHSLFQFLAMPQVIMRPLFNRYDVGMFYQDHIDFPLVGGPGDTKMRADLSITLFVSRPDEYDGGELVVETPLGTEAFKLEAGQAIVYPAYYSHRVNPVTRGSRIAAITTVQSFIREEVKRDLIADLLRLMRWVQDQAPQSEEARLANKIHANLIRIWADD